MDPNQVQSDVNAARTQGNALQNQFNQQANQSYGQYQQAYGQQQGAQSTLADYSKQLANQNAGDQYKQAFQSYQQQYAPNLQNVMSSDMASAGQLGGQLSQANQQFNQAGGVGGYGLSAGQLGNYEQGVLQPLQTGLTSTNAQLNAANQVFGNLSSAANQQTTQQLAGQQQGLSGYEAAAQNATNIAQQAASTMQDIELLQQNQGRVTSDQITNYQNAYSTYIQAQAAAQSASAQMLLNKSSANQQNFTTIQTAIAAHPNATNAQLAAETGQPESVIAGIRAPKPSGTPASTQVINLTPNKTNTSIPAQIPTTQTGKATQFAPQNASQLTNLIRRGIY